MRGCVRDSMLQRVVILSHTIQYSVTNSVKYSIHTTVLTGDFPFVEGGGEVDMDRFTRIRFEVQNFLWGIFNTF